MIKSKLTNNIKHTILQLSSWNKIKVKIKVRIKFE